MSEPQSPDVPRHNRSRRTFLGLATAATGAAAATAAITLPPMLQSPPTAPAPAAAATGRFDGKVVLVTGGTSGIGEASARLFAAEGAQVVFCGRREQLGREIAASIGANGHYVRADVRVPQEVENLVAEVDRRFGRLDVAFNNAGIRTKGSVHELSVDQWDDISHTNARGVFLSAKYEIPLMLRSGGGVILCTASESRAPDGFAYSASKQAIKGMVDAMAIDYGTRGIRVNAIAPGTTDTALVRPAGLPDPVWDRFRDAWGPLNVSALERMARPQEIARAVVSLCTDEFAFMTGATVLVAGGPFGGDRMRLPLPPSFPGA